MPILRFICIALLLGLSSCSALIGQVARWKPLSKKTPADNRMGEAKLIGVIALVNPDQNYVLINCEQRLDIPAGTEIISQSANGTRAKLKVTPERKANYITADITTGLPQVNDLVLFQIKPGDVSPPAAESVAAPLTPIMQADVIPPLEAPFQPLPPTSPPPPTTAPTSDPSKRPPVIR